MLITLIKKLLGITEKDIADHKKAKIDEKWGCKENKVNGWGARGYDRD